MTITVYRRRFPVDGGPVSLSFVPFDRRPRYTLVVGDRVHESVFEEIDIVAPAEAKLNRITNRLSCLSRMGRIRLTAEQVYEKAALNEVGFRIAYEPPLEPYPSR